MLFAIFSFLFFFILAYIFVGIITAARRLASKKLELQFLVMLASTIEYKHYLVSLIEIVYNEKYESDEEKQKELNTIKQKIEEKFDKNGNEMIITLNKTLDYKLEYEDWKGAVKYVTKHFRAKGDEHR